MFITSRLGAAARLTAVVGPLVLCAGGTVARSAPPPPARQAVEAPIAQPTRALQLAALEPADRPAPRSKPAIGEEPFGLTTASEGPYQARWRLLQPLIRVEIRILALCRAGSIPCSAAATKFNAIVEAARARSGRARVGEVNRAVNLAIRPMSDQAQYGAPDIWASPLMSFASGAGDCEDYAIAKYVALAQAGMPAADLRLVVVHDRRTDQGHMVAAARIDADWLILDNRTMRLVADREVPDLTPLAALSGEQAAPAVAAMANPESATPAGAWNTAGLAVVL